MDMERYGDYTEYEDDIPRRKNLPVLIMSILIGIVCFSVVGFLGLRILLFNYYPSSAKDLYFTEKLTEYYNQTEGEIGAKTQDLRAPYDDPNVANFFCDNLIVIDEIGEIQVSVRFNTSAIENMIAASSYETLDPEDADLLTFRLYDNNGKVYEAPVYVGTESFLMYRYYKVVFDGIDLKDNPPNWIRIEIFVKGQTSAEPFAMVPIYENNVDYAKFKDYKLGKEERPA